MYEYISGKIVEIKPSFLVIETGGIGYFFNISLNTFSKIKDEKKYTVFIHQIIRDDSHTMYGFAEKSEREIFKLLILVSGVGTNTALIMLSSLGPGEIKEAVLNENETLLKSVKGIGIKTAKRIIIDLKDKIGKTEVESKKISNSDNKIKEEALAALVMLGFQKKSVEKIITVVLNENPDFDVESTVKKALKNL